MIDTHTHIYAIEFAEDREIVIERALAQGVTKILLPNIDEASITDMLTLCEQHPQVCFPMMGLHPTDLPETPTETLLRMEQMLAMPNHPFIAIGEVGIDLYWDDSRREEQTNVFRQQIEWSIRYDLPLIIHSRSSHNEVVNTLLPYAEHLHGGIFHCFGGTEEEAEELLTKFPNFALGIGGVVTFKKSTLPEVLRNKVPLNRIVLETDAPYLAPTPHRGKRNEPAYLPQIAQYLADIYNTTTQNIENITTETARKIFKKLP
ncbi:MAG: TatD family hydrolase [Bacteroidaceae bacterium]|nr:TatD family hydrolase [Bacteroidaceae bacterium]